MIRSARPHLFIVALLALVCFGCEEQAAGPQKTPSFTMTESDGATVIEDDRGQRLEVAEDRSRLMLDSDNASVRIGSEATVPEELPIGLPPGITLRSSGWMNVSPTIKLVQVVGGIDARARELMTDFEKRCTEAGLKITRTTGMGERNPADLETITLEAQKEGCAMRIEIREQSTRGAVGSPEVEYVTRISIVAQIAGSGQGAVSLPQVEAQDVLPVPSSLIPKEP